MRSTVAHSARALYVNRELARSSAYQRNPSTVDVNSWGKRAEIEEAEDLDGPGWDDWMFAGGKQHDSSTGSARHHEHDPTAVWTLPQRRLLVLLSAIRFESRRRKLRLQDLFGREPLSAEGFLQKLETLRILSEGVFGAGAGDGAAVPDRVRTERLKQFLEVLRELDPNFAGRVVIGGALKRALSRLPEREVWMEKWWRARECRMIILGTRDRFGGCCRLCSVLSGWRFDVFLYARSMMTHLLPRRGNTNRNRRRRVVRVSPTK